MHTIFFSAAGLRSGWRALLWATPAYLALTFPIGSYSDTDPWAPAAHYALLLCTLLLATWFMARVVDGQPFTAFGLAMRGMGTRLGSGLLTGFGSLTLLLLVLLL